MGTIKVELIPVEQRSTIQSEMPKQRFALGCLLMWF